MGGRGVGTRVWVSTEVIVLWEPVMMLMTFSSGRDDGEGGGGWASLSHQAGRPARPRGEPPPPPSPDDKER